MENIDNKRYEDAFNRIFPGLQMFVRDTNLSENVMEKYKVGIILRDPTFVDTSCRVGGMVTSHRYSILSNHYININEYEHGTNWGLCICQRDSHFKILDIYVLNNKTQIVLLHLDDDWELFQNITSNVEEDMIKNCRERFKIRLNEEPIPELTTKDWFDRLVYPIGINNENEYFSLKDQYNNGIRENCT
jgi:hypothetical protein